VNEELGCDKYALNRLCKEGRLSGSQTYRHANCRD